METKDKIIMTLQNLDNEISRYHENSELAHYVHQALTEIRKSEGVAFTGALQMFFNRAPIVKMSDTIEFNDVEEALWREIFSYQQLGNNLWGTGL